MFCSLREVFYRRENWAILWAVIILICYSISLNAVFEPAKTLFDIIILIRRIMKTLIGGENTVNIQLQRVQSLPSFQVLCSQTFASAFFCRPCKKCIIKNILNSVFALYHESSKLVSMLYASAFGFDR